MKTEHDHEMDPDVTFVFSSSDRLALCLCGVVLVQAIEDLEQSVGQSDRASRYLQGKTLAWVRSKERGAMSFVYCCRVLGFDAARLRQAIGVWVEQKVEGTAQCSLRQSLH